MYVCLLDNIYWGQLQILWDRLLRRTLVRSKLAKQSQNSKVKSKKR